MKAIWWNLYDHDRYVGKYTTSEICRMIGCKSGSVHNNAEYGWAYKERWRFELVPDQETKTLEARWDEARWRFLWDYRRQIILGRIKPQQGKPSIRPKRSVIPMEEND